MYFLMAIAHKTPWPYNNFCDRIKSGLTLKIIKIITYNKKT